MDGPFLKNANQKYTLKLFVAFYLNGPCSLLPLTGISRFPAKVVFNNYHLIKDFFKWANSRPLFDFLSFYFYNYSLNLNTKNWRKRRWCAWDLNSGHSVTSLGDFWRPMAKIFLLKLAQMYYDPLGYFEKHQCSCENCCGYFLCNLRNNLGYSLLQRLVTLEQPDLLESLESLSICLNVN